MKRLIASVQTYAPYVLVVLAVLLPLLKPGFVLALDMVFVPQMPLPQTITSSYPLYLLFFVLNHIVPVDIIQKILLFAVMLLPAIGMHRLLLYFRQWISIDTWAVYAASILFVINPFVYDRFITGQYAVLLGYGLLPWLTKLLIDLLRQPKTTQAVKAGLLLWLVGVVSIHTLTDVAIMMAIGALLAMLARRDKIKQYAKSWTVVGGIWLALSSYWLLPLAFGRGQTARIVQSFTAADSVAFATVGDNLIVKLVNVLRLQGFWAEARSLYVLPQEVTLLWGTLSLAIIATVVVGGRLLWRHNKALALWLVGCAFAAIVVAVGGFGDALTRLGFREPQKAVGLLVLVYAVLFAIGGTAVARALQKYSSALCTAAIIVLLLMPFVWTRVLFWGGFGQLTASHYPADWAIVKQRLQQDQSQHAVLFLPWHQYMSFGFANNRIIANPANQYFGSSTLVSEDPELDGATSGKQTLAHQAIAKLLDDPHHNALAAGLARYNVKYVMLAKELDWQDYNYVASQPDFRLMYDGKNLQLYQNNAWIGDRP